MLRRYIRLQRQQLAKAFWGLRSTLIEQTKKLAVIAALFALTACSLPRGAALQAEITSELNGSSPSFAVEEVTRASVARLASWPATGWHGHYHWPKATRGAKSNVIRSGDLITLTIWDSQANSLLTDPVAKNVGMDSLQVSPSGSIFVPYVDEVMVRGLTPAQARVRIQFELEPIAPSAQVQLSLIAGQDNSVDLVSGVIAPGSYPLPSRNYTILSLIAKGGGINSTMRNPIVRLIRQNNTYEIPAGELFAKASKNITLRGSDKVIVEQDSRYFIALGATGLEQLVHFSKESLSALEALSLVGGIDDTRANPQGVLVLREYPAKTIATGKGPSHRQVVFTLDLTSADGLFAARNFMINPNDTVLATESPITALATIINLFKGASTLAINVNRLSN